MWSSFFRVTHTQSPRVQLTKMRVHFFFLIFLCFVLGCQEEGEKSDSAEQNMTSETSDQCVSEDVPENQCMAVQGSCFVVVPQGSGWAVIRKVRHVYVVEGSPCHVPVQLRRW